MARAPSVDLVIPCLNEAHVLEKSVARLRTFLGRGFPYRWSLLIADNGSTDGTREVALELAERYPEVRALSLDQPGRGRALRRAWTQSKADVVAYTDVDLSTELEALEHLCRAILEDDFDLAVGSRLMRGSQITRGPLREVLSRGYNLFLRSALRTHFTDAQCGFKAVSRRVVEELVPQVEDEDWFFDTELLVLAEKEGYRVKNVPVRWVDDDDSRVKLLPTIWQDVRGALRLRTLLWSHEFRVVTTAEAAARHRAHRQASAPRAPDRAGERVLA
jgi:glycosyltransferase involved in cell wall biosynthesis